MKELLSFIETIQKLDSETVEAIQKYFVKETYKRNELIVEEGKVCSKVSFLKSGLVRRFYYNDGIDVTEWIYSSSQWITSLTSYFEQKPSFEYFQACEDTVLYSLSYINEQILLSFPLFSEFHIKLLRKYLAGLNEFHHVYKLMTATEKYEYIIANFPEIIKRAKLKHIASMLDVSQETLSRIRASIFLT